MRFNVIRWKQLLGISLLLVALPVTAMAQASTVAYQGLLMDASGVAAANGAYPMEFSIWDAAVDGTLLWSESYGAVAVSNGAYVVLLGGSTPFATLFADHGALWLQVTADIGTGLEVYGPRVPLNAAPFAKQAERAVSADTAADAAHATSADTAANATHAATADSATSATNAGSADNAAALGGQLPAAFATAAHTHDAAAVTSGILSTGVYSAYADLGAESKIGAAPTQVAAGDHRHTALPYFYGTAGGELTGTKTLATTANYQIGNTGTALVAPVTGLYFVHFQQLMNAPGAIYLELRHNGGNLLHGWMAGMMEDMVVSRLVVMNAGDTISFFINGAAANTWGGAHSTVSMWLIG